MKVEIKLQINLEKGKTLWMSAKEAKELQKQLNDLLGPAPLVFTNEMGKWIEDKISDK